MHLNGEHKIENLHFKKAVIMLDLMVDEIHGYWGSFYMTKLSPKVHFVALFKLKRFGASLWKNLQGHRKFNERADNNTLQVSLIYKHLL